MNYCQTIFGKDKLVKKGFQKLFRVVSVWRSNEINQNRFIGYSTTIFSTETWKLRVEVWAYQEYKSENISQFDSLQLTEMKGIIYL